MVDVTRREDALQEAFTRLIGVIRTPCIVESLLKPVFLRMLCFESLKVDTIASTFDIKDEVRHI